MEHIIEHLIKSENVCDDNCEPSKSTGEALMDKKELFDALDMLNYNEEEINLAVLYYRMFPSDYSISKDGIVNSDLERQLILVEWGDGQKVYPLDADGLLKNENNPDEWKDKHSKFKKKKKEQIWDKILEIAGLNSDINDLSVDNATTYYEIMEEERKVAKLKEEIWNLYSDEHMEGEHINQSDQHANGLQLDERPKPTCINEQHNHNCQQFYGKLNNCTIVCPSVSPSGVNAQKKKKQQKKGSVATSDMPKTIKYFKYDNEGLRHEQEHRVGILFRKWIEWKWIGKDTMSDNFDSFFVGKPYHCNINWTGTNAILTQLLSILLKQSFIERQTNCSAKHLVQKQFGKTPDFRQNRLDEESKRKIDASIFILDTDNPLPKRNSKDAEKYDIQDAALYEILTGGMKSTKGI